MEAHIIRDLVIRLKKVEGQMRGIQEMLESGKSSRSVITQLAAARAALDKVGFSIIANDLKRELSIQLNGERSPLQHDLKDTINLFMKLS